MLQSFKAVAGEIRLGDNSSTMDTYQSNLSGQSIQLDDPNLTDKFHTCQKHVGNEQLHRKQICGNAPFLTVVSADGTRKPLCKMHAKDTWIEQYETK